MPETRIIEFKHKELAEAMVRFQNIHDGFWGIYIKFGIQGANIASGTGNDLIPAAIVPVVNIGIQKFEKENNLTVDAAKVNPKKISAKKAKK